LFDYEREVIKNVPTENINRSPEAVGQVAVKNMEKGKNVRSIAHKKSLMTILKPYLFILPAFAFFAVFLFYPFIRTIFLSLFLTSSVGEARVFEGLGNYLDLFSSPDYLTIMLNTLIFSVVVIVGAMLVGFVTANLANIKGKMFGFFAVIFAAPIAVSTVSFSIVFSKMFEPTFGIINSIFHTNIQWFLDPNIALYSVAFVTVWMMSGSNFLFIHAGLKNVPASLIESAEIDGATGLKKIFYITIPCVSPILFFVLITNVIAAFQAFTQINVITQGGPGTATDIMVYNIYRDAFFNFRFGSAAAQSIVLFLIILVFTLIQFKNEKRMVHYV
jgi:ABC-type sugar transport systems, permease components